MKRCYSATSAGRIPAWMRLLKQETSYGTDGTRFRRLRSARDKSVYLAHDRKFDCRVTIDVFASNIDHARWADRERLGGPGARQAGRSPEHRQSRRSLGRRRSCHDGQPVLFRRKPPNLITHSRESGEDVPIERILEISTEIAHGLAYIHGRRILYFDLQPRNVLFDEWGQCTWWTSTPRCRSTSPM